MAYKLIESGFSQAKKIGDGKNGTSKIVEGFIVATKDVKITGQKPSTIYILVPPKGGQTFEMWGNGCINFCLKSAEKKKWMNKLFCFSYAGVLPKKKGFAAGVKVKIEKDDDAKLPAGAGRRKF